MRFAANFSVKIKTIILVCMAGVFAFAFIFMTDQYAALRVKERWTLFYLDQEQVLTRLTDQLHAQYNVDIIASGAGENRISTAIETHTIYRLTRKKGQKLLHNIHGAQDLREQTLKPFVHISPSNRDIHFFGQDGKKYLAKYFSIVNTTYLNELKINPGYYLAIWSVNTEKMFSFFDNFEGDFYAATKSGEFIERNNPSIGSENYTQRPLVSHFVASPITRGETVVKNKAQEEFSYGFFMLLPRTNLVAFAEVLQSTLHPSLYIIFYKILAIFILGLIFIWAVITVSYWKFADQIRKMSEYIQNLTDIRIIPPHQDSMVVFAELKILWANICASSRFVANKFSPPEERAETVENTKPLPPPPDESAD